MKNWAGGRTFASTFRHGCCQYQFHLSQVSDLGTDIPEVGFCQRLNFTA
jgi:hypothetical protein